MKHLILLFLCLAGVHGQYAEKLPSFNVYNKAVTLSGFSSGGTFAQMFQISYSSLIHGIAVFSHTYYRCGPPTGKIDDYDKFCTKLWNLTRFELYNPDLVHKDIDEYYRLGYIENPANLYNKPLYVYTGLRSFLFTADQSLGILKVYEKYVKNPARIMTKVQDADLLMPTRNPEGIPCNKMPEETTTFIGNCGFSGPQEALSFLLSPNYRIYSTPSGGVRRETMLERLKTFDQTEFLTGLAKNQMDNVGYYYQPTACERKKCLLHFYFHGCMTGREFQDTKHIEQSGILEIAEASDIIMIFPQAKSSEPENGIGCWDTFGIAGKYYATKRGDQVAAVKRIFDRVVGYSSAQNVVVWPASATTKRPNFQWSNGLQNNHVTTTVIVSSNKNRGRPKPIVIQNQKKTHQYYFPSGRTT